ncbi:MAG TPA: hypothetical protein VG456_13120 [Candidatus Sulfopaludibacter sp.]|jgi:hypothetical protein|nr:hypothetical protein [Candidatus Sulfopaludibacter sp.]
MSFQWLTMRISEEKDRRKKEASTLEQLPRALEEVQTALAGCIEEYQGAFGAEAADMQREPSIVRVIARQNTDGYWRQNSQVEVKVVPALPGFQIDNGAGGDPFMVEVGLLPGAKLYFRDRVQDQYITIEELTRRILDRAFFPKLPE